MTRAQEDQLRVEQAVRDRLVRMANRPRSRRVVIDAANLETGEIAVHVENDPDLRSITLPPVRGFLPKVGEIHEATMKGNDPILEPGPGDLAPDREIRGGGWTDPESLVGFGILANGDAYFNDITARGFIESLAGPELLTNGTFEVDASGWDASIGATVWQFNGSTHSWTGTACSIANEPDIYLEGTGGARLTRTTAGSGQIIARSPIGASGVPVIAGDESQGTIWLLARDTPRTARLKIRWYNGASFLSEDAGDDIMTSIDVWRPVTVEAIAPVTATRAALSIEIDAVDNGEIVYVDSGALTGATNSTFTRSTAQFYEGVASGRLRSLASLGSGGPAVVTVPPEDFEIVVEEGQFYYFRFRYRQSNGLTAVVVANWMDENGVYISSTIDQANFIVGSSSWKLHTAVFEVPPGVSKMTLAIALLADAVDRDLFIDSASLRKMSVVTAAVIRSQPEIGDSGQTSKSAVLILRASETGFPYAKFNGHVFSRAIEARLTQTAGSAQTIPSGTATIVTYDTRASNSGCEVSRAGGWIKPPRIGYYHIDVMVNWASWIAAPVGTFVIAIERWSGDGSTFLEAVTSAGFTDGSGLNNGYRLNCGVTCRVNAGERVLARVLQDSGQNRFLNAGALGVPSKSLSMHYVGDAV